MKVLYVTRVFPAASSPSKGAFLVERVRSLVREGVTVDVARPNAILRRPFSLRVARPYSLRDIGYDFDCLVRPANWLNAPWVDPATAVSASLHRLIQRHRYDIVHGHFLFEAAALLSLKRRYGVPYVVTAHGSDVHSLPGRDPAFRESMVECLENACRAIFVSRALLEQARSLGYSGKAAVVIPNGVSDRFLGDPAALGEDTRPRPPVVGFIGNLVETKGADRLPGVFARVRALEPQARFIVVGDGPLAASLKTQIHDGGLDDYVQCVGRLAHDDIPDALDRMSVLVSPSRAEGWGVALLEAFSRGVSVVATDTGGIPEALGGLGRLVRDGSGYEARFAQAVVDELHDPTPQRALLQRAASFAWSEVIHREIALYRDALADGSAVDRKHGREQ